MKKINILLVISIILIVLGIGFQIYRKSNSYNIKTKNIVYIVKNNETLKDISIKFDISSDEIIKINNLKDTKIKENDKLIINNVTLYRVKNEDNLETIAKKFNTLEVIIKTANDLKTNDLEAGKKIIIPNTKIEIIRKNDTLQSIAKKYNVSEKMLKKENKLKTDDLKDRKYLIIPKYDKKVEETYGTEMTMNEADNYKQLSKIGNEIFNNKKYLLLPKEYGKYYLSITNAQKIGYDITKYAQGCSADRAIIYFDIDHQNEYKGAPISIIARCN